MAYELRGVMSLTDDFSSTIRNISRTFKRFKREIQDADGEMNDLTSSTVAAASSIDEAADQARQLSRKMEDASDNIEEATRSAMGLRAVMAGMRWPDIDMSRLEGQMANVSGMVPLIVAGLAAAVSVGGPLLAAVGGLAASLGAATAGAVAFGAVAVSSLTKVFEAAEDVEKIQEKIDNATTAKQRIKAEKELAQLYEGMSKAQQGALKELQNFKSFWGEFTAQFDEPVFQAFDTSLEILQKGLKAFAPTISSVGEAVNNMLNRMNAGMESSGVKDFFTWLEQNAARSLESFATIAGNTIGGLIGIFQAFAPTGASIEQSLVNMTARFREWGQSLAENNQFKAFLEYAKVNAPIVMNTLKNMFLVLIDTVKALAPLGTMIMSALGQVFGYIHENFSTVKTVVGGLVAAFAGFKIITMVVGLVRGAIVVFTALKNTFMIAKNVFSILRAVMLLFPGGWIIRIIMAVIAAGVALYKNWDTVSAKAAQLKDWVIDKWNAIKEWTSSTWDSVKTSISNAMENAKSAVSNFFSPLLDFIDRAKGAWDGFTSALKNFKMPKISIPSVGDVVGRLVGGADGSHKTGLASVPFDGYCIAA